MPGTCGGRSRGFVPHAPDSVHPPGWFRAGSLTHLHSKNRALHVGKPTPCRDARLSLDRDKSYDGRRSGVPDTLRRESGGHDAGRKQNRPARRCRAATRQHAGGALRRVDLAPGGRCCILLCSERSYAEGYRTRQEGAWPDGIGEVDRSAHVSYYGATCVEGHDDRLSARDVAERTDAARPVCGRQLVGLGAGTGCALEQQV